MKKKLLALCAASVLLLLGCQGKVFYAENQHVNEDGWKIEDRCNFEVEITDTIQPYEFYLDLRTTDDFPYSDAYLLVKTTFPDNSQSLDTLCCPLFAPDGRPYGRRSGRYLDNRYVFRESQPLVRFPMAGTYRFTVTHGMRDSAIVGLNQVGLRLCKAE